MLDAFSHATGAHCGSTSLHDVAAYGAWDLPEPVCFGIGGGLGFSYYERDRSPSREFVGRTPWLETAFFAHLDVDVDPAVVSASPFPRAFRVASASAPDGPSTPDDSADRSPGDPASDAPSIDSAAGEAAATPDSPPETDGTEQIADRSDEDTAQASARSEVVSPDELDRASRDVEPDETPPADEPQPGIDALRDELNDQFESIRIVSPGQYELNLMELYDRQEYIISLQEDGRYVIEMPDAWGIQDE